ncbi:MAG: gliding motility-associated C-terminal domain-containing protein [Bacteroidota bacterium]
MIEIFFALVLSKVFSIIVHTSFSHELAMKHSLVCILIYLVSTSILNGQSIPIAISNGDFEDTTFSVQTEPLQECEFSDRNGGVVNLLDWCVCPVGFNSPNVEPFTNQFENYDPSSGNFYIHMVARSTGTNESINQRLPSPILPGITYAFTIDLANIEWFDVSGYNFDLPGRLFIWGSTDQCGLKEILWKSPIIDHKKWQSYSGTFRSSEMIDHITLLSAWAEDSIPVSCNVLIDNLSDFYPVHVPEQDSLTLTYCSDQSLVWQPDWSEEILLLLDEVEQRRPFVFADTGTYEFTLKHDELLDFAQTLKVRVDQNLTPEISLAYNDTSICLGDQIEVQGLLSSWPDSLPIFINWNDGINRLDRWINREDVYVLEVDHKGCKDTTSLFVSTLDCSYEVVFPTVFTPNGDGLNDVFSPILLKGIFNYNLMIFDRWGRKIYESDDSTESWDGRFQQEECREGTFFYVLSFQNIIKHNLYKKGSITLLR